MDAAPSIKEALELARKYIQDDLDSDLPFSTIEGPEEVEAIDAALATVQPSGERRGAIALADMVYKAIKFTDEAAGEGICFEDLDPALILCDYAQAIGTDCWDGMAEVARDAILASGLTSVPLVPREAIARIICEQLFGPFDDTELAETSVSGQSRKCADAIIASGFVQDEAGWRPISTAPKDETEVLVYVPRRLGPIYAGATNATGKQWWSRNLGDLQPTHWMPLPALAQSVEKK